ncbi:ABC transporter permease [Flexistipes sinusarabici]|uniref:ABC transporter permease n=1 Tax=Flexistipes sinusarabici TaxID=2352 RepID=UPI00235508E1|nr:FtsX-like permease family protein [Flexistipes sinusarabici]
MFDIAFKRMKSSRKNTLFLIFVIGLPVFILSSLIIVSNALKREINGFVKDSEIIVKVKSAAESSVLNYKSVTITTGSTGGFFDGNFMDDVSGMENFSVNNIISKNITFRGREINISGMNIFPNGKKNISENGIIMGSRIAEELDIKEKDRIDIKGLRLQVESILKDNPAYAGSMIAPLKTAQNILNMDSMVSEINIYVPYKNYLNKKLDSFLAALKKQLPSGLEAYYVKDAKLQRLNFLDSMRGFYTIFIMIIFVSVVFIVFNYLLNNIKNQKIEAGVMSAVGFRMKNIIGIVSAENFMVAIAGIFFGFLLSVLSSYIITMYLIGVDFTIPISVFYIWGLMIAVVVSAVLAQTKNWIKTDPVKLIKNI